MGVLDDLVDISANLKFCIQLVLGLILVWQADIRIISFYGLFGVESLPQWVSYLFSITVIAFFVNAYNLIDGIDSLSSSLLLKKKSNVIVQRIYFFIVLIL